MAKIYIETLKEGYLKLIQKGLEWVGFSSKVKYGDCVFIKPNLTFPYFLRGVMTNPDCLENLIIAIKDYTDNIIIGEADTGGYTPFAMDKVLEKIGAYDMVKRHGIKIVNLAHLPSSIISFNYRRKKFKVPLPRLLLEDIDLFITVPVPKVHTNTIVSMSIKNQWGCISEPTLRMKFHPYFEKVIYEVNKALKISISIIDGKFGLNRNGPLRGDAVNLNWLMVSDDIYVADLICCYLMQIDPQHVYYMRFFKKEGVLPNFDSIHFNQDYKKFVKERFYLKREWTDYPGLLAFRSGFIAYWAYYSPLAELLHKILYIFRKPFF